ncbi:alpha-1,2-fucosyltransferase [Acinetobacter brisouii]
MIIFFSDGRLGNQIFQYAFLNTIARKNEKILTTQMLNFFDCKNNNMKTYVLNRYTASFINLILKKILYLLIRIRMISYICQDSNEFSALPVKILKKGLFNITYVETNFFQSEIFFDSKTLNIKIKSNFLIKAERILESIPCEFEKVFVHVRRGDYLFEQYLKVKGIDLPKKYFMKAIDEINKKVKKPFFIFLSDDPHFVECAFESIENKYISRNEMAVDLALMSLCEYGICSNSSFSWWGAYLMMNKKLVFMPKYWYGWKIKKESHIGIQPSWCKIIEVE